MFINASSACNRLGSKLLSCWDFLPSILPQNTRKGVQFFSLLKHFRHYAGMLKFSDFYVNLSLIDVYFLCCFKLFTLKAFCYVLNSCQRTHPLPGSKTGIILKKWKWKVPQTNHNCWLEQICHLIYCQKCHLMSLVKANSLDVYMIITMEAETIFWCIVLKFLLYK